MFHMTNYAPSVRTNEWFTDGSNKHNYKNQFVPFSHTKLKIPKQRIEVALIDSAVTAATTGQNFDRSFARLDH